MPITSKSIVQKENMGSLFCWHFQLLLPLCPGRVCSYKTDWRTDKVNLLKFSCINIKQPAIYCKFTQSFPCQNVKMADLPKFYLPEFCATQYIVCNCNCVAAIIRSQVKQAIVARVLHSYTVLNMLTILNWKQKRVMSQSQCVFNGQDAY